MLFVLKLVFFSSLAHPVASPFIYCGPGTFLQKDSTGKNSVCQSCPKYTFNGAIYHQDTSCHPCFKVDYHSRFYDVISDCNATADAHIQCKNNTYRDDHFPHDPCIGCRNCTLAGYFEKKPCSENEDSVCCPVKGVQCANSTLPTGSMISRTTSSPTPRQQCVLEDFVRTINLTFTVRSQKGCLKGEFYVCSSNQESVVCSPCPASTFMNQTHHFQPKCLTCDPGVRTETKECNITQSNDSTSDCPVWCYYLLFGNAVATVLLVIVLCYRWVMNKINSGKYNTVEFNSVLNEEKVDMLAVESKVQN